jgi:hypothetical protein
MPIWQPRFYDFNLWTEHKRVEKLPCIAIRLSGDWCMSPSSGQGAAFATANMEWRDRSE